MLTNMGKWDRTIRLLVGIAIVAVLYPSPWALLGLVPLVTAAVGYCPLYRVLGWSSARPRVTGA